MAYNYTRARQTSDMQIAKFGGGKGLGLLRREGIADRKVTCAVIDYKPNEQGLREVGARRAMVSALDPVTGGILAVPPDHNKDKLIFAGEVLRIVNPDRGPRPSGVPVYHDLEVLYDSRNV